MGRFEFAISRDRHRPALDPVFYNVVGGGNYYHYVCFYPTCMVFYATCVAFVLRMLQFIIRLLHFILLVWP